MLPTIVSMSVEASFPNGLRLWAVRIAHPDVALAVWLFRGAPVAFLDSYGAKNPMKTNFLTLQVVAVLTALALAEGTAEATSTTLNFSAAVAATLPDSTGQGTGFTTRLSGTGANITGNDPNTVLDTGAGVLHLTSPLNTDPNGVVGAGDLEYLGLQLAPLGFNSTRDFSVTANFLNVPGDDIMDSFDQVGVFVGTTAQSGTRAMVINFDAFTNTNEFAAVNSVGGGDVGGSFNVTPTPIGNMSITIARSGGVWTYTLIGTSGTFIGTATRTPAQPTFLNSLNDLTVGVFTASTNATAFTVDVDSVVVNVPVPGDANGDGFVTIDDFTAISDHLFSTVPSGTMGDANLDGVVTYADFRAWKDNYVPPGGSGGFVPSLVPEPSTVVLGAFAVLLGMFRGRRFVS
jgi:hypothetical protein